MRNGYSSSIPSFPIIFARAGLVYRTYSLHRIPLSVSRRTFSVLRAPAQFSTPETFPLLHHEHAPQLRHSRFPAHPVQSASSVANKNSCPSEQSGPSTHHTVYPRYRTRSFGSRGSQPLRSNHDSLTLRGASMCSSLGRASGLVPRGTRERKTQSHTTGGIQGQMVVVLAGRSGMKEVGYQCATHGTRRRRFCFLPTNIPSTARRRCRAAHPQ